MYIALEGIDACGKETQARNIKSWLEATCTGYFEKYQVVSHSFPKYGSVAGGVVGRILNRTTKIEGSSLDFAVIIQSVMIMDRLEHLKSLRAEHDTTHPVDCILDRYRLSGMVYGQADGLPREWLEATQSTLLEPDLTILLDISVEESFKRRPSRQDLYEEDCEKLEYVRQLYIQEIALHTALNTDKGVTQKRYVCIDGSGSERDVLKHIVDAIGVTYRM